MIIPLFPAAVFASLLIYGLRTGKMPAGRASPVLKSEMPGVYWICGAIWGCFAVGCVVWFLVLAARS